MARKARKSPESAGSEIKLAIMDMVSALWDKHEKEIEAFRDESEDKKVKVNFGALIDYSKSNIKVTVRFSQAVTDECNASIEDPAQGTFEMTMGKPAEGKRNSAPAEAETATE